ncbi:MAG: helix-turn-helix domain-containing protein [Candidatus Eisenbacteria bacterium]|nr:helix-turn-helix domain-containing protein [Candidatus Eisenbacteria bacterium]
MADLHQNRDELQALYERMPPRERRQRIILEPAFRDAYNRITEADRIVVVQRYFWDKWVPILGPVPSMLYLRLRQYCYHNPQTGEVRAECWPRQDTLAREIGVKDRKTIRRALVQLEELGFIERKSTYRMDQNGRPQQGSDHYLVFFEIPLVASDAAELLIQRTNPAPESGGSYEGKKSPHNTWLVDKPPYEGKISPHVAGEKIPTRTSTRTITSTLTNVDSNSSEGGQAGGAPAPKDKLRLSTEQEALAFEIGETLHRLAGIRSSEPHKSAGFHRVVCSKLAANLVREALAATRDAVDRAREGGGGLQKDPGGYFAGAVKRIAEREGVDLGLGPPRPRTPSPRKATTLPQERRSPPDPTPPPGSEPVSSEEGRAKLRAMREMIERKLSSSR